MNASNAGQKNRQRRPRLSPPWPPAIAAGMLKTGAIIGSIFLVLLTAANAAARDAGLFRIGTGGRTGVYYPIGKIIAQGLTEAAALPAGKTGEGGFSGTIAVAQNSAGSIDNTLGVAVGDLEAGLVQADVAAWAFASERVFKDNNRTRSIRAVASLYPEKFQIVTRNDAKVSHVRDLRGKRISVDEVGSGTLAVMRIVLQAHGLTEKDFQPVYLKPAFTHDKIVSGDLQGFVMMAGAPMDAVTQLSSIGIDLVPILPDIAARIEASYPYLTPGVIPSGIYAGIPETPTIQVHALLVVNEAMDDAFVYQLTAALWSPRMLTLLQAGHAQGRSITLETALDGISIPLHPGARRFYRDRDMPLRGAQTQ